MGELKSTAPDARMGTWTVNSGGQEDIAGPIEFAIERREDIKTPTKKADGRRRSVSAIQNRGSGPTANYDLSLEPRPHWAPDACGNVLGCGLEVEGSVVLSESQGITRVGFQEERVYTIHCTVY